MTARRMAEILDKKNKVIEEKMADLHKQQSLLREEHEAAIREMVYEESLLGQITWVVNPRSYGGSIQLEPDVASQDKACEIADILGTGGWYHFGFDLKEPGCQFRFDDYEVRILFEPGVADIPAFIRGNKLAIDFGGVDEEIGRLQHKVEGLQSIKDIVR